MSEENIQVSRESSSVFIHESNIRFVVIREVVLATNPIFSSVGPVSFYGTGFFLTQQLVVIPIFNKKKLHFKRDATFSKGRLNLCIDQTFFDCVHDQSNGIFGICFFIISLRCLCYGGNANLHFT